MSFQFKATLNPQVPAPAENLSAELARRLGRGLSLPIELADSSQWRTSGGADKIRQAIYAVLTTPVGRRLLQPDFGSLLPRLIFEPWTSTVRLEIIRESSKAIAAWVPSVIVESTECDLDETGLNVVILLIRYTIRGSLFEDTAVVPLKRDDSLQFTSPYFTINGQRVFSKEVRINV